MMTDNKVKGLSIFQRLLISYLFVGIFILSCSLVAYFIHERRVIRQEVEREFETYLRSSVNYFNRAYTSRINDDLSLIEIGPSINDYLSSRREDLLLNKSRIEQIFLHFTGKKESIYLSMRFIDPAGAERVITAGNRRQKNYTSLITHPDEPLYTHIYSLFRKLRSSRPRTILVEGPFAYQGAYTFLAGIAKTEPEVGGFGGAVILHCDLTDYFSYLKGYTQYKEYVASVLTHDGKLLYSPVEEKAALLSGRLQKQKFRPVNFYSISKMITLGSDNRPLFLVMFSAPPYIFRVLLTDTIKDSLIFIFGIMIILVLLAVRISRHIEKAVNLKNSEG
ncbi:MAG: hypothetical protein WC532_07585 [Candidatus Omnitrophota bacterium]